MQSITINHGRDWGIEQRLRYFDSRQNAHIILDNRHRLPLQISEVCSYSLKPLRKENDHTWDPASQSIAPQLRLYASVELFTIEYQVSPSQSSDFRIVPAKFFVLFWCGKVLVRTTPPFSSTDNHELEKQLQQYNLGQFQRRPASERGDLSIERFEAMAESVTATNTIDKTNFGVTVGVKKRDILDSSFYTLILDYKSLYQL